MYTQGVIAREWTIPSPLISGIISGCIENLQEVAVSQRVARKCHLNHMRHIIHVVISINLCAPVVAEAAPVPGYVCKQANSRKVCGRA